MSTDPGTATQTADDRHRLATMASPTGIFLMDGSGGVTFVNPRSCAILGATESEMMGKGFLSFVHPDDRARAVERTAHRLVTGESGIADYRIVSAGRAERWIRVWSSPIRESDGRITGLAGVLEDITETRAKEAEARALELKLQQTHKLESMGLLAGGIAHDFNNMLMGIIGNAAIAQMDVPEESEAGAALADLVLAAERATELTAQLMAYAGRGRMAEGVVELNGVVQETCTLLRSAMATRARVRFALDPDVPPVTGDATRLRQVVMNLVTNAADALDDGGGEITVRTATELVNEPRRRALHVDGGIGLGAHVVLEVRDNGCGMTQETLERIFDPFFTTKKKGRGLGLAATLGTIRAHKAGLEVVSAPGNGTTFRLLLPASDVPAPRPVARPTAAPITASGAILVVDDDAAVRDVTRRLLSRHGFDVLDAADGAQGIALLTEARDRIRCVLLDLTMPGMDSAETFRRMREVNPTLPVVVTSGHSERTISAQFEGMGVAGFLHKPFDISSLIGVTKAALEGQPFAR